MNQMDRECFGGVSAVPCPIWDVVFQPLSRVRLCDPVNCSPLGFLSFTTSRSLLRFVSTESVMPLTTYTKKRCLHEL